MPRVFPPEPKAKDKDRPPCPRCGGPVYKMPDMRHWNEYATGEPVYVCKAGRKEHTCGHYWRQGGSGHIFFEATKVTASGLLELESGPLMFMFKYHREHQGGGSKLDHRLLSVVRPRGAPRTPDIYECPKRPSYVWTAGNGPWKPDRDWTDEYKEFLRQHADVIRDIPWDVLDGLPRRPIYGCRLLHEEEIEV